MKNKNLSQKTWNKIKREKIAPRPKWIFSLKYFSLWAFLASFVLIGGLSFSIIFFVIANSDWRGFFTQIGFFKAFLLGVPFFG